MTLTNPYVIMMRERTMLPSTYLTIDNAKLSDVAARLAELDPNARYRVNIERLRTREEIVADMDCMFAAQTPDPQLAGLSEDEIMEIIDAEIAASRAERDAHKR